MPKIRFAKEGWLFIIPAIIITAAALLLQWWTAAIIFGFLTLFLFNFFRDPHRAARSGTSTSSRLLTAPSCRSKTSPTARSGRG